MKVVTVKFGPEEFESLQAEADRLQLSVTQLIRTQVLEHRCALCKALILSAEMSLIREQINQIIRREVAESPRLYEDDLMRLEQAMTELEKKVSQYILDVLRNEVIKNGSPAVSSDPQPPRRDH